MSSCNFIILFYIFVCFFLELCFGISYRTLWTPNPPAADITFEPLLKSKTCQLRPKEGPCRGEIEMYYFNPEKMHCDKFTWGGCQGNGNRFDTENECLAYCLTKESDPKRQPPYCRLEFDYGYCFGAAPRWYFDRRKNMCMKGIYSGCGGNKNNFNTEEACQDKCMWLRRHIPTTKPTLITAPASPDPTTTSATTKKSTNIIEVIGKLPG